MKRLVLIIAVLILMLLLASCNLKEYEKLSGIVSTNSSDTEGLHLKITIPELQHGRAVLIELPTKEYILADCGTTDDFPEIFELLRKSNVKFIDHIILTSDSEACIGGLDKLLSTFKVGEIHVSELVKEKEVYRRLCTLAAGEDVWLKPACEGTRIYDFEAMCVDVVSSYNCVNSQGELSALSLYVTYGDNNFFIEGDGDYWSETEMVATMPYEIASDVLVAANCGSGDSSDSAFLQTVNQDYAVIPMYDDRTPSSTVLKAMKACDIKVIRTDYNGTITIASNGKQYSIEKDR